MAGLTLMNLVEWGISAVFTLGIPMFLAWFIHTRRYARRRPNSIEPVRRLGPEDPRIRARMEKELLGRSVQSWIEEAEDTAEAQWKREHPEERQQPRLTTGPGLTLSERRVITDIPKARWWGDGELGIPEARWWPANVDIPTPNYVTDVVPHQWHTPTDWCDEVRLLSFGESTVILRCTCGAEYVSA